MTALTLSVLAAVLVVAGLIAHELILVTGRRAVDAGLAQAQRDVARGMSDGVAARLEPLEPAQAVRSAAVAYLAEHPPGVPHLILVRIGDDVLSAPGAPAELAALRDRGALPAGSPGGLETLDADGLDLRSVTSPVSLDGRPVATLQVVASLRPVQEAARREVGRLLAAGALSLALGAVALTVLLPRQLRALRSLAATARGTELTDLTTRVEVPARSDEVAVLAHEFNRMLDRLEQAKRGRDELFAAASHELRTPVTIARGHVETLAAVSRDDPGAVARTAEVVAGELQRMSRLVEDLMLLARSEGTDLVALRPVDLDDLLDDLRLRLTGLGRETGVRVDEPPEVRIRADPDRLTQALLNLVVNAQVHTASGTTVRVGAIDDGGRVELSVSDDGGGLPPEVTERAFEPFVRGDRDGSTGLGLAVVRAVAEAHGHPPVLRTGPGGTTVTLTVDRADDESGRAGPR